MKTNKTKVGDKVTIYTGDCRELLKELKKESVHAVITRPPAWGIRKHGHRYDKLKDSEIGWERTGEDYVRNLAEVLHEVKRVLHPSGTLIVMVTDVVRESVLQSIPGRIETALCRDGWLLRDVLPIVKRVCMREPVTERLVKSLEWVYCFTKKHDRYFDMEAVRRQHKAKYDNTPWEDRTAHGATGGCTDRGSKQQQGDGISHDLAHPNGRGMVDTDLWFDSVDTPYGLVGVDDEMVGLDVGQPEGANEGHHSRTPVDAVKPFVLMCTSKGGCCPECLRPWVRVMENGDRGKTLCWDKVCLCGVEKSIPCTILDPFMGSGTIPLVAMLNGRKAIGMELYEDQAAAAIRRLERRGSPVNPRIKTRPGGFIF